MIDWDALPTDWSSRYRRLGVPWRRFLPRYLSPRDKYEQLKVETRVDLLPRSEKRFLQHAIEVTTAEWSVNWQEIMLVDSGREPPRSRSRAFVPIIATISDVHVFPELEQLSNALGRVLIETNIFPSVFFVTSELREVLYEARNPSWLITESLSLPWGVEGWSNA